MIMTTLACVTILAVFCCIGGANAKAPNAGTVFADVVSTLYLIPLLVTTVIVALVITIIKAPFNLISKLKGKIWKRGNENDL